MKRYMVVMVLAVAALFCPAGSCAEEAAAVISVEGVVKEAASLFPRAEGAVTESGDDGRIKVNIGSADGIKPGMDVFLFRGGRPIIHPVTKAVLGNTEEPLGRMAVDDVSEHGASGKLTELLVTRIVPGDIARLSTKLANLLVVTETANIDPAVLDRLLVELRGSGRFNLMGPDELSSGTRMDGGLARDMAVKAGADDVITLSTKPAGKKDKLAVAMRLYNSGGDVILDRAGEVDVTPEVYSESVMDFPLVRGDYRDYFVREELPYRGKHMAAGDMMGEGGTEVVVSDEKVLVVYRFEDRILRELWRGGKSSPAERQLAVDCADLNENGRDEIYVTQMDGESVASFVMEFDGTTFKKIYGPTGLFFRVLDVPGQKSRLITGTKGHDTAYSGSVYEYAWKDGTLVKGERLPLPSKIKNPYGFALADIVPATDKGAEKAAASAASPYDGLEVVWVDDSDYIQVLGMDGKLIWKSDQRYGGYDTFFEKEQEGVIGPDSDPRGRVKGRLTVVNGPDGGYDIVLTKNIPVTYALKRFRGYTSAEIYSLFWNGKELEPRWSIKNIEGFISDIYVGGVIKQGRDEMLALVEPTMKIEKKSKKLPVGSMEGLANILAEKSSLMVFKVPQR